MAAALLIGTNLQAATFSGNTAAELQDAIYAIMSSDATSGTITLSQDVDLDRTIWVGTVNEDDDFKSITIDLNGHNITMNGELVDGTKADQDSNRKKLIMFSLTHGELKVINSSANEAKVQLTGKTANNSRIFEVFGTYRNSRWNDAGTALEGTAINTRNQGWFSHLEIGQNVLLYAAPGCRAEGIAIASQGVKEYYKDGSNKAKTTYGGNIFQSSWGFAQGVRVDFKGKMDIQGDGLTAAEEAYNVGKAEDKKKSAKVYGFSVKGTIRSALSASDSKEVKPEKIATSITYTKGYADNYYSHNGTVEATSGVTHKLDTLDAPFIYIHPESEIKVRNDGDKVGAIYAAGYAKWTVKGYVAGKTGMYVSSGTVDLQDAYVKSTANVWENTSNIGSANGGGSGVVLNSRDSYAGDMEFVVSGDTKIESVKGYAIEEAVNTTTVVPNPKADPESSEYDPTADPFIAATNVSNVTIESGTIVGGAAGAIIISGPTDAATAATDPDAKSTVVVYGGNVTGISTVGTNGNLDDLIPESGYRKTEVEVGDKTVYVISQGGDLTPILNWADIETYSSQENPVDVEWQAIENADMTATTIYLGELQITSGTDANNLQQLTIPANGTLQVKHLVMNSFARIIVEAGGKLIVTGDLGSYAPVVENIVLKYDSESKTYATFLFNPAVSSNRHPNAKVEFTTNSWRNSDEPGEFQWEWFGIPTYYKAKSITSTKDDGTAYAAVEVLEANHTWTFLGYIGESYNDNPDVLARLDQPFVAYNLLAYRANNTHAPKITIAGELVGNMNASLLANKKWNTFANSYTAEIDAPAFINYLAEHSQNITPAVYVARDAGNSSIAWDAKEADEITSLKPMQAFLLNNPNYVETATIDYNSMVYGFSGNHAPRRARIASDNTAKICVNVANENGTWDDVVLRENVNTLTIEKYLNNDVNIYVVDGEKNDIVAYEDLENTYVGFSTVKGGNFTISFTKAEGREFDLIDLETGARVAASEGETYSFSAAANTTNDYRFKLVAPAKMPTAIENTEVKANAKGIFTLTGQFVGEMNVWNTLPAGVYVVNGAKRVK